MRLPSPVPASLLRFHVDKMWEGLKQGRRRGLLARVPRASTSIRRGRDWNTSLQMMLARARLGFHVDKTWEGLKRQGHGHAGEGTRWLPRLLDVEGIETSLQLGP